ncbi:MAG: DUF1266 domain-containing protein [Tannerella sp.]|jgi:hypothetical protein|nr:DUF1266 domain-containing protein [Tannerella sp.]
MKKYLFKCFTVVVTMAMCGVSVVSCGGDDSKTIEDEKLAGYMLAGIYVYYGYGDSGRNLITQLEGYVPEGSGFVKRLHNAYLEIMVNPYSDMGKSDMKRGLRDWWDVNDKDGLSEMIASLQAGRHSVKFQKIYDAVKQAGGKSADAESLSVDGADDDDIQFVIDHYDVISPTGIKAWDYVRAANLVYYGQGLEWLTIEEGEALLSGILSTVRNSYSDWGTYYKDFELGRRFWSGGSSDEDDEFKALTELVTSDNKYVIYNYLPLKK